jgi:hypothetical protein
MCVVQEVKPSALSTWVNVWVLSCSPSLVIRNCTSTLPLSTDALTVENVSTERLKMIKASNQQLGLKHRNIRNMKKEGNMVL